MKTADLPAIVRNAPPANRAALMALRPSPPICRSGCVLAIDPGCTESAFILYDAFDRKPREFGKGGNQQILDRVYALEASLDWTRPTHLAIEMVAGYGLPVGCEVFETVLWIGRFIEAWVTNRGEGHHTKVYRKDVKRHLCGSTRAKDPHVRQALIDMFGPGKAAAVGTIKNPGPLYGVSKDVWAALAVAVTWYETPRGEAP